MWTTTHCRTRRKKSIFYGAGTSDLLQKLNYNVDEDRDYIEK
jgi:hypothetical protein